MKSATSLALIVTTVLLSTITLGFLFGILTLVVYGIMYLMS